MQFPYIIYILLYLLYDQYLFILIIYLSLYFMVVQ